MKILSAEYTKSVARLEDLPRDRLPQIAFAGRSNVGKSTLLNVLFNRRNLAYVSSTPGKTQTLNFYRVNRQFYFVDLPGYGYAKSPKSLRQQWQGLIESYLTGVEELRLVVVLVDVRLPLQELDAQLLEWLRLQGRPFMVVATKADKLSGSELQKNLAGLRAALGEGDFGKIVPFSAKSGRGKEEVWRLLQGALER
ncbi:MAG TPA: ribosome biogenesis GTP-binding protein YihA/YsxC [bacterium]|nr:ribosome biogenesis GTP-binding protein YihA/YsxC [bacterium]HOY44191.1 ribosome biogenesis GTP-binding protein YihA/YsxC [bacterium]HPG82771.1 ribosome biogenesis GTP-binding protein YihA/YsxC [bacterium]HPM60487.1 ribosome biogenesis GTP-binding protein YihA/YsxC [bacterium]